MLFNRHVNLTYTLFFLVFLMIFGSKIWIINNYSGVTPFWDEWENLNLIISYLSGDVSVKNLLSHHNEHIIFFSKLWTLLFFELNGFYSPYIIMISNAFISVLFYLYIVLLFGKNLNFWNKSLLIVSCAFLFLLPYGEENTRWGFQSQFLFQSIFSVSSIYFFVFSKLFSRRWCVGLFIAALTLVTSASGFLVFGAGFVWATLSYAAGREGGVRSSIAVAVFIFFLAVGRLLMLEVPYHEPLKAHSIMEFLTALSQHLRWPWHDSLIGVFVNFPALFIVGRAIYRKRLPSRRLCFIVMVLIWVVAQEAAISYSRFSGPLASRYLDIDIIGILCNLSLVFYVFQNYYNDGKHYIFCSVICVWICYIIFGVFVFVNNDSFVSYVRTSATWRGNHTFNISSYLSSGDFKYLDKSAPQEIPYPSKDALKSILDKKEARLILPAAITGNISKREINQQLITRGVFAKPLKSVFDFLQRNGLWMFGLGMSGTLAWLPLTASILGRSKRIRTRSRHACAD